MVVSNGSVERYRHPRSVTLRAYATIPDPPVVLQTNKCFPTAPCANVPDEFIADAEPGEHDGTILIRTMDGGDQHLHRQLRLDDEDVQGDGLRRLDFDFQRRPRSRVGCQTQLTMTTNSKK